MRFPVDAGNIASAIGARVDLLQQRKAVSDLFSRLTLLAVSDLMIQPDEETAKVILHWHAITDWSAAEVPVGDKRLSDYSVVIQRVGQINPRQLKLWLRRFDTTMMVELHEQVTMRLVLQWIHRMKVWKLEANAVSTQILLNDVQMIEEDLDTRWKFAIYILTMTKVFEVFVIENLIETGS
jgi:hypothetical protein